MSPAPGPRGAGAQEGSGGGPPSRWGHSCLQDRGHLPPAGQVPRKPLLPSRSLGAPHGCRGHHSSPCSQQPLGGGLPTKSVGLILMHPSPLSPPEPAPLLSAVTQNLRQGSCPRLPGLQAWPSGSQPQAAWQGLYPALALGQGQVPRGLLPAPGRGGDGRTARSPPVPMVQELSAQGPGPGETGASWAPVAGGYLPLRPLSGPWPAPGSAWRVPRAHSETQAACRASLVRGRSGTACMTPFTPPGPSPRLRPDICRL